MLTTFIILEGEVLSYVILQMFSSSMCRSRITDMNFFSGKEFVPLALKLSILKLKVVTVVFVVHSLQFCYITIDDLCYFYNQLIVVYLSVTLLNE